MNIKERLSAKDKRNLIQNALNEHHPYDSQAYPNSPRPLVQDVFDEAVVYELGGSTFEVGYVLEYGFVTLGENTKQVMATTIYKGIESLREKYAELIQEAGERGIDSEQLRETSELCTTLLESEEPDHDAVDLALSGLYETLNWVKAQESMKTEDGEKYPAAAFAYAPDINKPSTWKLRIWENTEQKETVTQVGGVAAALSPGGYYGKWAQINSSSLPGVKARIREAYRKLGAPVSKWVQEVEMRERVTESCEIDIKEVTAEGIAKGIIPVRIIVPGFNSSKSRYYTEGAIKDAATIFDGAKMYADHATESEEKEKPERSIRDWVATLHETKVSESGNAVGMSHINAGWLKEKIQALHEQGDLQHLGTSINAVGKGSKQTVEGQQTLLVEGLVPSVFQSVDFVTEPGAGGRAGLRESVEESILDVELVDEAQLREARPDIVTNIEEHAKETLRQEVKEAMEATKELEDLKGQVETLTVENGGLKTTIEEAEKEKAKAEAQAVIKEAIDKAELPDAAKTRLVERFADATTDDGVAEAIKAETEYIKELTSGGKVKGLGNTTGATEEQRETARKALKESFIKGGMSEDKAELAVAGR